MFEAAHRTAPIPETGLPQAAMACCAALTAISARMDSSSLERSGRFGAMRAGSRTPALSSTKRDLMPEAFSMNSTEEGVSSATSPSRISAAWSALKRLAYAL